MCSLPRSACTIGAPSASARATTSSWAPSTPAPARIVTLDAAFRIAAASSSSASDGTIAGRALLVADVDPVDRVVSADGVGHAVERVAGQSVDAADAVGAEGGDEVLGDGGHVPTVRLRLTRRNAPRGIPVRDPADRTAPRR